MEVLTQMSNLGVAGLAVFLFYKISAEAITNNTKALHDVKNVIEHLTHTINK